KGLPLFESLVVFDNYQGHGYDLATKVFETCWGNIELREIDRTGYPLTLSAGLGAQLSLRLIYDRGRFDDGTITRMLGHLSSLLEGIAADPKLPLSALPLLTEPERRQLLVEWNATEAEYPRDRCVHELFEAQAERAPNRVAVAFEGAQLTYHELDRRANRVAH